MKKLLYPGMALAFLGSMSLAGNHTTFAAQSAAKYRFSIRLCSSAPANIGGDAHIVQGIWHGVAIASTEWRPKFKKLGITVLKPRDMADGKADGSAVDATVEASNAHTCLSDPAAIGYIGTLNSSMAQVSEPILNKGSMAMISPSNTNPVLTSPLARGTYEPKFGHGLRWPTYYRVVTTDALQGPVGAIYAAKTLGVKNFFLVDDQQTYGAGLAQHFAAYATSHLSMSEVGSGHLDTSSTASTATSAASVAREIIQKNPQAVYCGCDEPYAGPMLKAARRAGFKGQFLGGDAINDVSFGTFAGGNANVAPAYSTTVGNPSAVGGAFTSLEHKYYKGWTAGPYDALAFDASNVVLEAAYKSAEAGHLKGSAYAKRNSILKYIANGTFHGTGGTFHFDRNGDTSLRVLSVWKWAGSAWSFVKLFNSSNIPATIKPTP